MTIGTRTREGFSVKKTVQWTVFRKKSPGDSESQLVCKAQSAAADGESLMVHQKTAEPAVFIFVICCGILLKSLLSVEKSRLNQRNIIQVKNCVNADKLCDFD